MRIGFVGIGYMGKHMSRRILEAGYDLTVHDLQRSAGAFLLEKGAKWANTPKELAQSCDIVISSLPTPRDVETVVNGENGLKYGWKRGDIYIDMSTNSPSMIKKIATEAEALGVSVLDAPVSGGTGGAELGTLTIIVGGDVIVLEKVRQVLKVMGPNIFHVGEVGCGNIVKLVNNMIVLACSSITAEAFVLGVKAGMDPQTLFDIVKVSTGNNHVLQNYPTTVFKGNFEPGFKVSLGCKDIGLALSLGEELKLPHFLVAEAVQKNLERAMQAGFADKAASAVILNMEKEAGVDVRSGSSS